MWYNGDVVTENDFSEYGKEQIRQIVREEVQRLNLPFWRQIWRVAWIVLDAVAKRWGFSFTSAFEKRIRGAGDREPRGRNKE